MTRPTHSARSAHSTRSARGEGEGRPLPDLSEDRGDGRSRVYATDVQVVTDLRLTVQRDGDTYIATVRRVGLAGFEGGRPIQASDDNLADAIASAAALAGCRYDPKETP